MIKYKWLAAQLNDLIRHNLRQGIEKLPAESRLCQKYGVSRQTVRLALSLLEEQGLIVKKKGSGSYLTGLLPGSDDNEIGILVPDPEEYIYPQLLSGMENTFLQNNFSVKRFATNGQISREKEILTEISARPWRGLIAEGCKSALPNPNLNLYRRLADNGCRLVFVHNDYPQPENHLSVKYDNIGGSIRLVEYLVKKGHKNIGGFFMADSAEGLERYQGFMEAMESCGLPVPDKRIGWFRTDDLEQLKRFGPPLYSIKTALREFLDSCSAVVCHNDIMAWFFIRELQLSGHQLPDDLEITAFHNEYLNQAGIYSVKTLICDPYDTGVKAARLMIDALRGAAVTSLEIPWRFLSGTPWGLSPGSF